MRWAGNRAWSVEAKKASRCFDRSLARRHSRRNVCKIGLVLFRRQLGRKFHCYSSFEFPRFSRGGRQDPSLCANIRRCRADFSTCN